jgi:hypothetical protein
VGPKVAQQTEVKVLDVRKGSQDVHRVAGNGEDGQRRRHVTQLTQLVMAYRCEGGREKHDQHGPTIRR